MYGSHIGKKFIQLAYGGKLDNSLCIDFREVINLKVINIVIIEGEEVLVDALPDKEGLANRLNTAALEQINYIVEETA